MTEEERNDRRAANEGYYARIEAAVAAAQQANPHAGSRQKTAISMRALIACLQSITGEFPDCQATLDAAAVTGVTQSSGTVHHHWRRMRAELSGAATRDGHQSPVAADEENGTPLDEDWEHALEALAALRHKLGQAWRLELDRTREEADRRAREMEDARRRQADDRLEAVIADLDAAHATGDELAGELAEVLEERDEARADVAEKTAALEKVQGQLQAALRLVAASGEREKVLEARVDAERDRADEATREAVAAATLARERESEIQRIGQYASHLPNIVRERDAALAAANERAALLANAEATIAHERQRSARLERLLSDVLNGTRLTEPIAHVGG